MMKGIFSQGMRLKQIKLAGFKSFVDPTQVPFPAAMTCVVGPNGCGKSNVIDAVRWVLGESSAKNLRGDAMTDVIFNGSTQRKPVSQASVELLFENTQGKLQGSLADRSEISLKRLVTRDAQSHYFLNGTKCRRRDITDIFLGTGLGPRSYAIIEQGMISRLIESRPQDLRVFLEEAAGISKYKERRRETETRIKHTRDNLDRLADVREELGKNLDKLKRQAAVAERYKELKASERRYKAELTCLRWLFYQEHLQQAEQMLAALEVDFERFQAQGSGDFRVLTEFKQQLEAAREAVAVSQQKFYQLGADISALEQQLLHQRQRKQSLLDDERNLTLSLQHGLDQMAQEQAQLEELQQQMLEQQPDAEICAQQAEELSELVFQSEQRLVDQQALQQRLQQQLFDLQQQQRQLQLQSQNQQQQSQQLTLREQQLTLQQQELAATDYQQKLQAASELQQQLQHDLGLQQATLTQVTGDFEHTQQQLQTQQLALSSLELSRQHLQKQQQSLQQQIKQLMAQKPLLPDLTIAAGWSVAVAVALAKLNFSAVLQDHHPEASGNYLFLKDFPKAIPPTSLAAKISSGVVPEYFAHIHCAEDDASALQLLAELRVTAAGEATSVICKNGHWYGLNWRLVAGTHEQDNPQALTEREQQLGLELADLDQEKSALQQNIEALTSSRQQQQLQLQQLQASLQQLQQQTHQAQTNAQLLAQQQQQVSARLAQIAEELAQVQQQLAQAEQNIELWQLQLAEVGEQLLQQQDKHSAQQQLQLQLQQQLQQYRQQQQQLSQQQQQFALSQVSIERQIEAARLHLQRTKQQHQQLAERLQLLTAQLELLDEPDGAGQEQLQILLLQRDEIAEQKLQQQNLQSSLEQQVRELEQGQHGLQQQLQSKQKQIESARLEAEGYRVRANNMLELLSEQKVNFSELQATLPGDATESVWQQQLDKASEALNRLGPINLAAIEEYAQQDERKKYLDLQHDDLIAALDTLETAIRKIDRETRQKFKETFDQVNSGLQNLFPKVFGGGSAYLELTDEDLLETGVSIMARPPGKKNSTIHLLSGGEKALTALSLVFSIFRLNPAPFCMLDEVDAPLDDANVGRFCNLVREMSETVQFIYISHNKIAMEMATQLMGVTMQEPGVSRVVAVDVEDAVKMAQA
nr:chromosome segregation protein SMC [Rheinheimera sp. SA_1]